MHETRAPKIFSLRPRQPTYLGSRNKFPEYPWEGYKSEQQGSGGRGVGRTDSRLLGCKGRPWRCLGARWRRWCTKECPGLNVQAFAGILEAPVSTMTHHGPDTGLSAQFGQGCVSEFWFPTPRVRFWFPFFRPQIPLQVTIVFGLTPSSVSPAILVGSL